MKTDFNFLTVEIASKVATVIIDNPPINIITLQLYAELIQLVEELQRDPDLSVVVFKSANPDFFLAHFDVEAILQFPTEGAAERSAELNPFHLMCERLRTMNKVTIAQIEGRVGGGGSELVASMDMRFGVIGKTDVAATNVRDDLAFRASYGLTFNWKSPFGPVRFDLARPIAEEEYDSAQFFRFTAGTRF